MCVHVLLVATLKSSLGVALETEKQKHLRLLKKDELYNHTVSKQRKSRLTIISTENCCLFCSVLSTTTKGFPWRLQRVGKSWKLASISRDRVPVSEKMKIVFSLVLYFSWTLFLIQLLTNEGLFRINLLVDAEMTESKEFMSGKVLRVGVFHVSNHID